MKRAGAPGNITLSRGEANLPKKSVDDNDPNYREKRIKCLTDSKEMKEI
jgi:hypothetical protein